MSEAVSALQGAAFEGLVAVRDAGLRGMVTLRGTLSDKAFAAAIRSETGLAVPAQRGVVSAGDMSLCWMSPDELLLLCPHHQADVLAQGLAAALAQQHALVANISDARAVFQVRGSKAREVMAKLAPVDLAPGVFEKGEIRRTRLAQVAAAFYLTDETTFEVICFRSVAQYMFDLLSTAADPASAVDFF